jgi:hypothetical protein
MAGLPHYQNSLFGINNYEPVYLNQFEVIIQPPTGVSNPVGNPGRTLLVENVLSVSGLSVDKNPQPIEQRYKFSRRRYAGGAIDDTGVKVRIEFETNLDEFQSNYVFKTLRQWSDLVYNPLTGAMGTKSIYAGGSYILISVFNKQGDVFRRIKLMNCFPVDQIKSMDLDYSNGSTPYKLALSFRADYFEDVFN